MHRPSLYIASTWRPPVGAPIADEVALLPMSDETAHAIARQWLRDIAAAVRAKADIVWTSTADRDMTGAFPVVRAA